MPLSRGDKLGRYEILERIGAGGMGEVYLARDTELGREVALKTSAQRFSERFAREAKLISSLNHPNICTLFDVGPDFLVMEYIEGHALDQLIQQGPLAVDEALEIARQIGLALEEAHGKQIVHRDLKPGNVKIRPDGMVKVLDFGLAKALVEEKVSPDETRTLGQTEAGVILGTPSYMSPEQARGQKVDKRTDIWAFGAVLYEMLTGRRLFQGATTVDTLAQVVNVEPDWKPVPPKLQPLLKRCLEKDARKRLRDISGVDLLLEPTVAAEPRPSATATSRWPWALSAALALASAGLGYIALQHYREEPPRTVKMSVLPAEKSNIGTFSPPAISPDGRRVAFVATVNGVSAISGVWVRDLDGLTPRLLPGTEGAILPFWSPDSRYVGFFANGKLQKIDVTGGPPITICDAPAGRGGTWSSRGVIVFAPNGFSGLQRVSSSGGIPVAITALDEVYYAHRFPWFLPDGRHFLFKAFSNDVDKISFLLGDLDDPAVAKSRRVVLKSTSIPVYSAGHLLFVDGQTLFAQPFDLHSFTTAGERVPIAEHVGMNVGFAVPLYSASPDGHLAYIPATADSGYQLTWFDRTGKPTGKLGGAMFIEFAAISPDGKTVAYDRRDSSTSWDIWLHDLDRDGASRLTFGGPLHRFPIWSPDGTHLIYTSGTAMVKKAITGTATEESVDQSGQLIPNDWSRDGKYLVAELPVSRGGNAIMVLPLSGGDRPYPYLQGSAYVITDARISPNSQWLAYTSNETGTREVYVGTFPQPGGKWQISTSGGTHPVWSRDGRELYFLSNDLKLMAVDIKANGSRLDASVAKGLFDPHTQATATNWRFDVSKDGRFLFPNPIQAEVAPVTVVLNWPASVKK